MTATAVREVAEREGFALADERPALARRAWKARGWIALGLVFAATIAAGAVGARPADTAPLSTGNTGDDGARALAQVLRAQGVSVRQVDRLGSARITDTATTTLAVALPSQLQPFQLDSILSYPGDIVLIGVSPDVLVAVGAGLTSAEEGEVSARPAGCDNADARAAQYIVSTGRELHAGDASASICFEDADGGGAVAFVEREDRTITLFADATLGMNGKLTQHGNAALMLRTLGHHASLVWVLASEFDGSTLTYVDPDHETGGPANPGSPPERDPSVAQSPSFAPPGTGAALWTAFYAAIVATVWLGRRFGALVTEPLPVVVPAAEATRGRARLYRRGRSYGRASAALRAASAERMGRLLGVPRAAQAPALIAAVARASERPAESVSRLLYGPPPETEQAMMDLVHELDALEGKVHRP